jgi:hypothetical protein
LALVSALARHEGPDQPRELVTPDNGVARGVVRLSRRPARGTGKDRVKLASAWTPNTSSSRSRLCYLAPGRSHSSSRWSCWPRASAHAHLRARPRLRALGANRTNKAPIPRGRRLSPVLRMDGQGKARALHHRRETRTMQLS